MPRKEKPVSSRTAGLVYIATGDRYFEEALGSIRSAKACMPEVPIAVLTDRERQSEYVDTVIVIPEPTFSVKDKAIYLKLAPYDKNLFIDTDTHLAMPVADVFELLDHFDIAAAVAPQRQTVAVPGIPTSFTELNTGVIAFRKTPQVLAFFEQWLEVYDQHETTLVHDLAEDKRYHDQPSFREALYHSDLRYSVLPPEYNCMYLTPGGAKGPIRVFHGREKKWLWRRFRADMAPKALNRVTDSRAHMVFYGKPRLYYLPAGERALRFFRRKKGRYGMLGTLKLMLKRGKERSENTRTTR
jgi:hypothetical protein